MLSYRNHLPNYLAFRHFIFDNDYNGFLLTANTCKFKDCMLPYFSHILLQKKSLPKENKTYLTT